MVRDDLLHRRLSRRTLLRAAAGIGLAIPATGLLAACGGDDDDDDSSGSALEPSPTVTVEGGSVRGGTLKVALTGDPPNLDLMQTTDSIVMLVTSHFYETLFTWDADYRAVPLLAASHEVSEDGLVNTVKLREDVPFHNGEAMQAADVIASVNRWGKLSGLGESLLEATDEIVEVDPTTIEFRMNQPFGTFAMSLARQLQGCAIYPKSILDKSDESSLAEYIGTGPYRFVEWEPDVRVRVERFDDYAPAEGEPSGYAGAKAQHLDAIEFIPVRNEASRIAGIQAGDYHYLETASPDQAGTLAGSANVAVDTLPADAWLNIVLNLRSVLLSDLNVRRAVQTALDHAAIMQAAFGEGYYELTPELIPGAPTWYSEAGIEYFNRNDPDEARKLLDEAGYDSTPLRIMTTQEVQQEYNGTLTMSQQLEAVGFKVDLQVYDGATLSDRRDDEVVWEMYTAWASFRPDPVMRNLTASAAGWWEDDEKDQLLADLQSEADYDKRFAIWEQVQARFYEDVPRLKIGNSLRILVRAASLQGIGPTEMQPEFSNAWLEG
ncbi:MAG TPA: ABC transporter substrate-binding protein [Thermomicrobiales bacterium]|nr:ABC transporter substrate-binding protein [Thermomicrobiales bacterium]